ncbi:MAG: leucyl aminopeptidase [Gemmatimonadaceae bacterium]
MTLALSVRRAGPASVSTPLLAVLLASDAKLPGGLDALDRLLSGALRRALQRRDFRGGRDETLHLSGANKGPQRVLLVGKGDPAAAGIDPVSALRRAAAVAARNAHRMGVGSMALYAGDIDSAAVEACTVGLALGAWEYTDLKTPPPEAERRASLEEAVVIAGDTKAGRSGLASGEAIAAGYELTRRLGMMPGNMCTPGFLADTARDIAKRHGMKVNVLGRKEMEKEKMGSFLCVAQGTEQDPKLITLEYRGAGAGRKSGKPIVLVGKGLCFDTGGVSIKPAQGMEWMKFDMSGGGAVLGAMEAIGRLKLAVNVVGIVGSTTNVVSGEAVKPGDVVRSHSGKTIEVINTDAEGRLVLADLLSYARRFEPAAVIDAATLTGAIVIALGNTALGVFGSDEALVQEVLAAGKRAAEPGWPLPMWDDFKELIKSDIADVRNSAGRAAGSITAALFLKEFVDGYPWVHLDVAGTAYSETDLVTMPKGPTGIPVGLFVEFVRGRTS